MPDWPILSPLSEDEKRQVLLLARRRRFQRGEVVVHRDDPADTMHLVQTGSLAVRVLTPLGDMATLAIVGPGGVVGEIGLVRTMRMRSATIQALAPTETHSLNRETFDRLRRDHPAVDALLVQILADRVVEVTERLVDALYTPAPRRVASFIETLADRYRDGSGTATIPLTQEDLASLAGTSRLTVSRVLRDMRARGQVEVSRGRLVVRAPGERVAAMLREIAEYPNSFGPVPAGGERVETPRFTLCMGRGSTWNTVQRQRFDAAEIDDVLAEVHGLLRERGRRSTQWEVGSAAEPANLVDLLLERGVVPDRDAYAVALVLRRAPRPGPAGAVGRRVETFEEYAAACEVQFAAFETRGEELAEARALVADSWADRTTLMHAVWMDGEVVSAGTAMPVSEGLLLYGGATAPHARGRGAYRALLRARWDEAAARGTPALITQGGSMSRPILERAGFEPVGHVHMLLDEFGDRA